VTTGSAADRGTDDVGPTALDPDASTPAVLLRLTSGRGRWVVAASVLGSGIASVDATGVGVALPTIGKDLNAGLASLQWVVTGYTLTLAGFLLLGGSLGDRYGRRRVFLIGVVWFAVASLLCGLAPSAGVLIAARLLQGVGGALLTPGSLAILEAVFVPEDRSAAIGAWSGLGGVATAIGPFVGGYLVHAVSWRLVFLINLPLSIAVVAVCLRHVPESRDDQATGRPDLVGATLAALALGGLTYALIEGPGKGWSNPVVLAAALLGVLAAIAFLIVERRIPQPMLPLKLFRDRQFSAANLVTFAQYGALGAALFLLPVQLQTVSGYSPVEAGTALLPVTVIMLLLSARSGRLASKIGPRPQLTIGPWLTAAGLLLMTRINDGDYLTEVLPAVLVLGFGLACTVAPLTTTVLAAAPERQAGIASAVNNDVARTAGLLAVAVLPALAGLGEASYLSAAAFLPGFQHAMMICAGLCVVAGVLGLLLIRGGVVRPIAKPVASVPGEAPVQGLSRLSCGLEGPTLCCDPALPADPANASR
jgi:EmrB/QacA subfamily drug resistance transporter